METKHANDYYYKYVTADTAIAILRTGKVRFSSPTKFNDPFDTQIELQIDFSLEKFSEAMSSKLKEIGAIKIDDTPQKRTFTKKIHAAMDNGKTCEEMKGIFEECYDSLSSEIDFYNKMYLEHFKDSCIFCISKNPQNLLMWAHYADSHEGAVIKLKPPIKSGDFSRGAEEVEYKKEIPPFLALKKWVKYFLGIMEISYEEIYYKYVKTKSDNWSYEGEYRAIGQLATDDEKIDGYADVPIKPEDIDEVVFGCRMSDEKQQKIASIISIKYPDTTIKMATKRPKKFELNYRKYI